MVLGMTIFLLFPFSRLVHVWSGLATLAYLFRPYQVVRSRRLNVPAGTKPPGHGCRDVRRARCRPHANTGRRRHPAGCGQTRSFRPPNCAAARTSSCCARRRSWPDCSPRTTRRRCAARSAKPQPTPSRRCSTANSCTRSPDEATCRRYHAANAARFAIGERVRLRHVLFAVTPGVDIDALRKRAEACLHRPARENARRSRSISRRRPRNCRTARAAQDGGELGWLHAEDCAPEFAREIFGQTEVGVLPRLVRSRFGLHVVEVLAREPGSGAALRVGAVRGSADARTPGVRNRAAPVSAVAGRACADRRHRSGRCRHAAGSVVPQPMPDELLERLRRFQSNAFSQYRPRWQRLVDDGQP